MSRRQSNEAKSTINIAVETSVRYPGLLGQVKRSVNYVIPESYDGDLILTIRDSYDETDTFSKKNQKNITFGFYYTNESTYQNALIDLYLVPHLQGIPKVFWWSTVPTILFARTIAHEMAHHIYLCRNELCYVTNSSDVIEGVANNYARDVLNQMRKERKYRLGFWWVKEIAFWHYSLGILDFRENKYASSADHFFYAWKLDPRLDGVASRYWAAIDKLSSS